MGDKIHDFDPSKGQAFQGDVSIIAIPKDIKIDRTYEIKPVNGRLILQEGEMTGHHHAITLPRPETINLQVEKLMADALANKIPVPMAKMFRDAKVGEEMRRRGIITRTDLITGILVVENGPMTLLHEEHDGHRLPPGAYLIGRQVESAGAEERRVAD
jgi:hypothetical protein